MEFNKLINDAPTVAFTKGETVTDADTIKSLYYLNKGFVKRFFIKNDGNISVQGVYGPADCFGISFLFDKLAGASLYTGSEVYYYEALSSEVQVKKVGYEELIKLLDENPGLYKDLFTIQTWHSLSNIWLLESKGIDSAYKQVAHILSFYAERYGKSTGSTQLIDVPFIQQDIADILALTRETVSHSIQVLKDKGLLKNGRRLIVTDGKRLKKEAYSL